VNTLGDLERKTWHDKQEEIGKERIKRVGESVKRMFENSKDHYPSWWEVYDKDGRRIWKMNLLDKAILAEWRRYDSLPPQERAAELREWMRTHIKKEETWGGIIADFGVAILLLIMFLLSPEGAEKILEEMEIAEGRGEKSGNEKKEKFGLDFRSLFGSKETAVSETPTSTLAMH
jgi:hypothetical protein